ncbi:MAG TPA: NAD-dependent epimerase/dehydratase family protein, partial [Gemmatimonadaceae bacterium]|nr:NAD-dependent epimerase/dehydratase family protein [Gemmatimonadaceae bacterium]
MTGRVLVTGGAGFIGSHVADLFVARGWDVAIVDDLSSGKRENVPPAARFHRLDVRSPEAVALVGDGDFDVVVHLAAQMDVRRSVADPVFDAGVNVVGTLGLLEAVRRSARARAARVVFSSTGGVLYGELASPPNTETTPKEPDSPYAIAKLAAEYYLTYYARIHGLDTVSLRFGNVYGPRQDPHGEAGVVAIFCGRILEGHPLTVFGDGLQTRDYIHVSDVAESVWLAATTRVALGARMDERAFNIGTGVGTPVLDVAKYLLAAASTNTPIAFAPKRPGE